MKTIEFDQVCKSCKGTGLYIGMGERDGSAVVCHTCSGTGCHHFKHEYEEFTGRKQSENVKRVFEANPGICIGENKGKLSLSDFGGMPFDDWSEGKPFPAGSENRKYTCPAWWYQSTNYDPKPDWPECIVCGSFSSCYKFDKKHECWEKFDKQK